MKDLLKFNRKETKMRELLSLLFEKNIEKEIECGYDDDPDIIKFFWGGWYELYFAYEWQLELNRNGKKTFITGAKLNKLIEEIKNG